MLISQFDYLPFIDIYTVHLLKSVKCLGNHNADKEVLQSHRQWYYLLVYKQFPSKKDLFTHALFVDIFA
jgi:hypothetical protein